ncbi:MAG TPA: hypothetical protein PK738_05800, partial [Bacteroidales bacterium]|nr:hypothetical protein [Bacteroidales bacterium]
CKIDNYAKNVYDNLLTKRWGLDGGGIARNACISVEYIIIVYKQWVIVLLYYAIFEIIACLINNQIYSLFDLV